MGNEIWDAFLTPRDLAVYGASGYHSRAGFGERPALLVVDINYNFTGERRAPILESVRRWRNSCGEDAWDAVAVNARVIEACRAKAVPVLYTTGERRPDGSDLGGWAWKNRRTDEDLALEEEGNAIVAEIAPEAKDIVIRKQKPSAFFGTALLAYLIGLKVDTLLVTGISTSGCVRATVVDGFSYNYRISVIADACADRSQASHAVNLCDMDAKYADVVMSEQAIEYIRKLPGGLFGPPTG